MQYLIIECSWRREDMSEAGCCCCAEDDEKAVFSKDTYLYVCMYVCTRTFVTVTRRSYSLSSHECAPVGQTEKMCL